MTPTVLLAIYITGVVLSGLLLGLVSAIDDTSKKVVVLGVVLGALAWPGLFVVVPLTYVAATVKANIFGGRR